MHNESSNVERVAAVNAVARSIASAALHEALALCEEQTQPLLPEQKAALVLGFIGAFEERADELADGGRAGG